MSKHRFSGTNLAKISYTDFQASLFNAKNKNHFLPFFNYCRPAVFIPYLEHYAYKCSVCRHEFLTTFANYQGRFLASSLASSRGKEGGSTSNLTVSQSRVVYGGFITSYFGGIAPFLQRECREIESLATAKFASGTPAKSVTDD